MINAKKILISRRRSELFVSRQSSAFQFFCESCDSESEFVSLADAVDLTNLKMREIVRRVEKGKFHFLETNGGHLFVCRESLADRVEIIVGNLEPNRKKEKKQ